MSCLGNIVWLVFGGFLAGLGYIIGGALMCVTIIGIPFGIQSIQLGIATMAPFGKTIEPNKRAGGFVSILMDVIWLLLFGWEIALAHLAGGVFLGITIIGIPFAIQHFKLIPVALFPYNYRLQ